MPELARKYERHDRYYYGEVRNVSTVRTPVQPRRVQRQRPVPNQKKIKKYNTIHRFISIGIMLTIGCTIFAFRISQGYKIHDIQITLP